MTATPTKTSRQQLDDLLVRLEKEADALLNAEVWDDQAIEYKARYRYVFTEVIGANEQSIANYLSDDWGMVQYTAEEIASGHPFKSDEWNEPFEEAFFHDYFDNICGEADRYLPDGWVEVPRHIFEYPTVVTELSGERLLKALAQSDGPLLGDYYPEDLLELDVLGEDREVAGEAMVLAGYLSNQDNLTGEEVIALQAYKSFTTALANAIEADEQKKPPERASENRPTIPLTGEVKASHIKHS